jgi:hypothetical protein
VRQHGDELGDRNVVIGRRGGQEYGRGASPRGVGGGHAEPDGTGGHGGSWGWWSGAGAEFGDGGAGAEAPLVDVPPQLLLLLE